MFFDYVWLNQWGQWKLGGLRGTRGGLTPGKSSTAHMHTIVLVERRIIRDVAEHILPDQTTSGTLLMARSSLFAALRNLASYL